MPKNYRKAAPESEPEPVIEGKAKWQAERLAKNEENQKAQDEAAEYTSKREGRERQAPINEIPKDKNK
jgi:hypothetical protein